MNTLDLDCLTDWVSSVAREFLEIHFQKHLLPAPRYEVFPAISYLGSLSRCTVQRYPPSHRHVSGWCDFVL